uniref:Uncharacterized protein n=1 Tax=Glossina pallidipes TaxID=7398 RepID=A0A1A9ZP20_GLOPL
MNSVSISLTSDLEFKDSFSGSHDAFYDSLIYFHNNEFIVSQDLCPFSQHYHPTFFLLLLANILTNAKKKFLIIQNKRSGMQQQNTHDITFTAAKYIRFGYVFNIVLATAFMNCALFNN